MLRHTPLRTTYLLSLAFFLLFCTDALWAISVKFRVTDDANNVLKGMTVRLYERNEVVEEILKAPSLVGFELKHDTYYTVEVELRGFVTKRVVIQTDVDENELKKDGYRFDIMLERMKDYERFERSEDVLDYPSAIIGFDTNSRVLEVNETYYLSTKQAFERLYRTNRDIKF